jgi:phosphoglycolate phosphatase-like HAD superfamily hydrolase
MKDDVEMETKEFQKISWDKSVWFFDIDDTLIDTAGTTLTASEAVRETLEPKYGSDQAKQIQVNFNKVFDLMLSGHQATSKHDAEAYDNLVSRIEALQVRVKDKYGSFKKWSREVFIKIAADDAGVVLTPDIVHEAANAYWQKLTENTEVFPGVKDLMEQIVNHHRPIYLITSSDARLKMDESGQFDYDPEYSETLKRHRIELLKKKGITFNAISVGDPEDKPHLDFFQKGINLANNDLNQPIDYPNAIMVGDSFSGDLQVPKEHFGFGLVVLFNKNEKVSQITNGNQLNTGDLLQIKNYIS